MTAGNASGINDGACALLMANPAAVDPLGASGARLVTTSLNQLEQQKGRYGLCSMCVGVGQGVALIIERL